MSRIKRPILWSVSLLVTLVGAAGPATAEDTPRAGEFLTTDRLFGTREFEVESPPPFHWSKRSATYFTLDKAVEGKGRDLVRHDPATGAKVVIVPAAAFIPKGAKEPLAVESFAFSADESKALIFTNGRKVWRRNTRGDYWVLDVATRGLTKLGGEAPPSTTMFAKFSPDATRVAYVRENNLYVQDVSTGIVTTLTADGSKTLINGTGDWVNEEELDIRDGFRWSPDGKRVLFWQFDTTGVAEFHLVNNVVADTPRVTSFAYPKVGGKNSATRLGVVPSAGGMVRWLDLPGDPREHYVPHAEWTPDGSQILVQQFNRLQTELRLYLADPNGGKVRKVFTESDAAWLENENPVRWLDGGKSLLWLSERSGWRHAYRIPLDGTPVIPITKGPFDVIEVEAVDPVGGWLYYAASPTNATQRHVFRVTLDGQTTEPVSPANQPGWHTANISPDARWAVLSRSNATTPPVVELVRLSDRTVVRTLADNQKLRDKLASLKRPEVTFFKVPVGDGVELDGWRMVPAGTNDATKMPLLMHVYGEPHGQTVRDAWPGSRGLWHWMLAQQGYVVASVDNRGTNVPRGRAWRKSVHRQIGTLASREQAQAVGVLVKRWSFVDPARVGSWGWSGGGSMSLNAVFRYPDVYRTAIAVAPVADQRLYDTIYQERYMGLPADNAKGYQDGSPITHAAGLRGNLLIVHGTGDDNCHYQGTERLLDELIARGKAFTVLPYPNRSHSVSEGRNTERHLYETMTRYFHDHLLSPHAPAPRPVYETRTLRGWTLQINRTLLAAEPTRTARTLELLDGQLAEIVRAVPAPALAELRKVPVYLNPEIPGNRAVAEYHRDATWLRTNGRDPVMARAVEISNVRTFESESRRMPNVTLHELSHAYHDRVLADGFGNVSIQAAYARARDSGRYDKVARHYGNGKPNTVEKAYALTSPAEYFAEATEAYFGRNDFFPFTRDELKAHDPDAFALVGLLWGVTTPPTATAPASGPPSLSRQLLAESPAALAKAARERGDAATKCAIPR